MTRIRPNRPACLAATVLAASIAAGLSAPAHADDPPTAEGRAPDVETRVTRDLPRPDAVLDAMPSVIYRTDPRAVQRASGEADPIATEATGAVELERPPLGERPTPQEALRRDAVGETIMRPRGGSATGGKPDVPPER